MIRYTGQGGDPNCDKPTIFIGELTIEPFVSQVCIHGKYNGQPAIIQTISDGSFKYFLKNTPGAVFENVLDKNLMECGSSSEKEYFEIIRLDGSLNAQAVPFRAELKEGSNILVPASVLVPGNTFTLDGDYDSFAIAWLPDTELDAGVSINGVDYLAKNGCVDSTTLPGVTSANNESFSQELMIEALDENSFLEILITRTYK